MASSYNIKVAIKVRPLIKREISQKLNVLWTVQGQSIYQLDDQGNRLGVGYTFDHIFDENKTNENVYKDVVQPVVHSCMEGFNGTIFTYGQTSSGKTYTMMGGKNKVGVLQLTVNDVFKLVSDHPERDFLIRCCYIEIYDEKINDLLDKTNNALTLREDSDGRITHGARHAVITNPEDLLTLLKQGNKNRKVGFTKMNKRSSHSHTILQVIIESKGVGTALQVSQLNLVDLAGSERVAQTQSKGVRLKEGVNINKSLSVLGNVIRQLSTGGWSYVNYRDSQLTRLLQDSLGGNAQTFIIANVTLAAEEETKSTLEFAQRAKLIRNRPEVNLKTTDEQQELQHIQESLEDHAQTASSYQWVDPHDMNVDVDIKYFDKVPEHRQHEHAKPSSTQSDDLTLQYLKRFISLMLNSAQKNEAGSSRVSGSYAIDRDSTEYQFLSEFLNQNSVDADELRKLDTILSNAFNSSPSQQMLDSVLSFQEKMFTVLFNISTLLLITTTLSIYIVIRLLKSDFSFLYVIRYLLLMIWIFDFGMRYKMMYEESENHNMHVKYSLECDTNQMTWVEWFKFIADRTKCQEKQIINPLDVILQQLRHLIVIPLSAVGTGMGSFGKEVWTQVGYPWNILIFPILLLFTALITAIILTAVNNKSFKITLFHLLHFEFGDQQQQPNTVEVNLRVENNTKEVDNVQQIEDNRFRNQLIQEIEQNNPRRDRQINQSGNCMSQNQVLEITENQSANMVGPVSQQPSNQQQCFLNELHEVFAKNRKKNAGRAMDKNIKDQSKSVCNNNETKIQSNSATKTVSPNLQKKTSTTTEPSHKECESSVISNSDYHEDKLDNCSDYGSGSSSSTQYDHEFEIISNADNSEGDNTVTVN